MIRKGIRRYDHENNRRKCIQQGECIWKGTGQYGIRPVFYRRVFFKSGEGWYQEEGKEAVSLVPGMVITIPANVKHWHGAKKDSWFSHIAMDVPGENSSNEWCEPVSDEDYAKLN